MIMLYCHISYVLGSALSPNMSSVYLGYIFELVVEAHAIMLNQMGMLLSSHVARKKSQ